MKKCGTGIYRHKINGGDFLKKNWKKDFFVSLFAGLVCGIVCAAAFIFIEPKKVWLAIPVAAGMAFFSFLQTALDKKLTANRYEKGEKEVKKPYFCTAEGILRKDFDMPTKFFFTEESVIAVYYKSKKPTVEEFFKEDFRLFETDKFGRLNIRVEDGRRIVFEKDITEELLKKLGEKNWR